MYPKARAASLPQYLPPSPAHWQGQCEAMACDSEAKTKDLVRTNNSCAERIHLVDPPLFRLNFPIVQAFRTFRLYGLLFSQLILLN